MLKDPCREVASQGQDKEKNIQVVSQKALFQSPLLSTN